MNREVWTTFCDVGNRSYETGWKIISISVFELVKVLSQRTSLVTEPSANNPLVMLPSPRSVHQLKLIPTASGCVSKHWISYEIYRFHVRKTALVVIDLLNCPTVVYRSNRSIEHYQSICYSFSVWPFEKSFLINATSSIRPPLMRANDKYYHKQTLKRVRRHRKTVELSASIFRKINWRMADALTVLCSENGVYVKNGWTEWTHWSNGNLLKISTWKAIVLDLTEINETPVVSRISLLHRNALTIETYVLRFQQCVFRSWSHSQSHMELSIAHATGIRIRKRQIANIRLFLFAKFYVRWVNGLQTFASFL